MYHHISPEPGLVTSSPTTFRSQMRQLAEAGYRSLHADEALAALRGETPIARKSMLLTFDDGFLDNWVHAYPILKEYGLCATVFVITGRIGDGPRRPNAGDIGPIPATPSHRACHEAVQSGRTDDVMMRWSELEEMLATGVFDIHSHTHSHRRWDQEIADPEQRIEAVERDLQLSQNLLRERLGVTSRHLCWPWGVYEERWREAALRIGFEALYTTRPGINTQKTRIDAIHRFPVKDRADAWLVKRSGLYGNSWLGSLYSSLRRD